MIQPTTLAFSPTKGKRFERNAIRNIEGIYRKRGGSISAGVSSLTEEPEIWDDGAVLTVLCGGDRLAMGLRAL